MLLHENVAEIEQPTPPYVVGIGATVFREK